MARPARSNSVCVVLRDFAIGGVPRLYIDMLSRLARRGVRGTVVAGAGPLADVARSRGIDVTECDWSRPRGETYRIVSHVAGRSDGAVVLCDPELIHAIPAALAGGGRVLVIVHSLVPSLAEWFGESGLERLRTLSRGLGSGGSAALVARGGPHRKAISALVGVDSAHIRILAPGIATDEVPFDPRRATGGPERVLVLSRLSPEAAPRIQAGVELVAVGLREGRDCRLELVGDGSWREEAFALARRQVGADRWRHEASTLDPIARVGQASVVVASGLTALESAAAGRRVVIARLGRDGGPVGPALTPDTFSRFSDDIFGTDVPAEDPREVWAALDGLGEPELARVRKLVETCNSGETQANAMLEVLGGLEPLAPDLRSLTGALGTLAAGLEDELRDSRRTADELWRAREWYEGQLAELGRRT
jgi:hypothetical protein